MRLQKALAQAGIASRRKAAQIIEKGQVEVNGRPVTQKGFSIDISRDRITVDGKPIRPQGGIYIILNKPKNCICTTSDTHLRKTVIDLLGGFDPPSPRLRGAGKRVYPVGRLDKNTTGLLLLTNDGELAFRLMHPRFGVTKTYEVTVRGVVSHAALEKLTRGLFVDGRRTSPAKVEIIYHDKEKTFLKIRIHEGRKRQVRLMLLTVGHPVISLKRTHFGNLTLGTLKEGKCRMLSASEVAGLRRLTGLK